MNIIHAKNRNLKRIIFKLSVFPIFTGLFSAFLVQHDYVYSNLDSHPSRITYAVSIPALESSVSSLVYDENYSAELGEKISEAHNIDPEKAVMYADWITEGSLYFRVPDKIIASLIMAESGYNEDRVSSVGAVGPSQIRLGFWKQECPLAKVDPRENVICSAYILKTYYLNTCDKNWECALKVYNLGPSNYRNSKFRSAGERYLKKIKYYASQFDGRQNSLSSNIL